MKKLKFFLDANIPYSSLEIFKKFSYDAEHARSIGMANSEDDGIIKYAINQNRILVSKDLIFGNIEIYPLGSHHGIIILRLPFYFNAKQINKALEEFLASAQEDEIKNAITIIQLGRYRIRR